VAGIQAIELDQPSLSPRRFRAGSHASGAIEDPPLMLAINLLTSSGNKPAMAKGLTERPEMPADVVGDMPR